MMMKKFLILMLVLGMASVANAAISTSLEYRDASGTTPISVVDVGVSTSFTLVVIGTYAAGEAGAVRMYDDFENLGLGSDVADMTGPSPATKFAGAGSLWAISPYSATFDGLDMNFGDPTTGQTAVDMFRIDISLLGGITSGTLTISSLDASYTTVLDSASITVIPEPMTVLLLGFGGLFLRRRKK